MGCKFHITILGVVFATGVATPLVIGGSFVRHYRPPQPMGVGAGGRAARSRAQDGAALRSSSIQGGAQPAPRPSPALNRLRLWLTDMERRNPSGAGEDDDLRSMIWALEPGDYKPAWQLAEKIGARGLQERFQTELLQYWYKVDARSAVAAANSLKDPWRRSQAVEGALKFWATEEPEAALAWVRESQPENRRAARLAYVVEGLARTNLSLALAAAQELPPGIAHARANYSLVEQWAARAPAAAAHYVTEMPPSSQRWRFLQMVADAWAQQNPEEVLRWAETLPNRHERDSAVVQTLLNMADKQPERAATLLQQHEAASPGGGGGWISDIVEEWAKADLPATAKWVKLLPTGGFRDQAVEGLVTHWTERDPKAAADFATQASVQKQEELARQAVFEWTMKAPKAAFEWAQNLAAGPVRDAALVACCEALALEKPAEAGAQAAGLPGEVQSKAAVAVASRWAEHDPDASAAWVGTFPESDARKEAAAKVIERWVWKDPAAAAAWLEGLSAGQTRQRAAEAYVSALATAEPELASAWVGELGDEATRNKQIERIAGAWQKKDPAATRRWLKGTSLSPDKQEELLE